MKAAFYTLGCKVNQVETQAMERLWEERGHTVVSFADAADAYVVNTCSVTAVSDQKSRQAARRVRREHPEAVIAVCGCFAQTHPADAASLGADLVGGSGDRAAFVVLLEQAVENRLSGTAAADRLSRKEIPFTEGGQTSTGRTADGSGTALQPLAVSPALSRRSFETLPAGRIRGRTRAMLKIEDGCANFCAYCIIPYARGPVHSLPLDTAVRQAEELAAADVREIVLTGIEISSWGRDLRAGQSLIDLTEAVCRAVPDVRVRLGSLEPRTITEEFCGRAAELPNLCPQFHLSLQSGCDDTLRRMRRKYDTARFSLSADLLRGFFERPALTTDLIAGFPGETEEEFSQTLDFLDRVAFARVHVFPYSPRSGTPAAEMEQVPASVKEERARRAAAAAARTRTAYLSGCVGRTYPVLFERPRGGRLFGRAPNYMEVFADVPADRTMGSPTGLGGPTGRTAKDWRNQIASVRIASSDADALYGEIVEA